VQMRKSRRRTGSNAAGIIEAGGLTEFHLTAHELVVARQEANRAVFLGDHGAVGDRQDVLTQGQNDLDPGCHARPEARTGAIQLDDALEVAGILPAIALLDRDLVDRNHPAVEDELGQGFKLDPGTQPRGDAIDHRFVEGHLDLHLRQIGQIKEHLFLAYGHPLLDLRVLGVGAAPSALEIV